MAVKKIAKNMKFEEALQALEEQVALLESGELPLEDALDAYKYGIELSKLCVGKLNAVKQEVEKIVVDNQEDSVDFTTVPFQDLED